MSLPKTFTQAAFKENGGPLVVEEVELTLPSDGQVLVKVEACGVCHSDKFPQFNGMGAGFPFVPGHEFIGRVAAVPSGEKKWKVGDRIGGGWHGGHDGTCNACQKGMFQMCDNKVINGETVGGGYAQYCKIRSESGVRIPEDIDAKLYAPVLCAGVATFNSIRQLNVPHGSTVAIHGIGGLGHLAIQYANKLGYRVVAISRGSDKEEFAKTLGAHEYIDAATQDPVSTLKELGGASLVVSTSPNGADITPLLGGLGPLGKLLVLSVAGDLSINVLTLMGYGLSVHSWPSGHAKDAEDTIAFTKLHGVNCMTQTWPLEQANEAYNAMVSGDIRFRAVITMED
uniref:Enoyl reductase (ER) domain-containing protein n=1 Tax=Bionectria ochroleuca TaxID=29856 RepID=A0A8H7K3D5_BIOOC